MQTKVLSLFCGCGGLDLGFESAGFRTVAAFDLDHTAVATYNSNFNAIATITDLSHRTEFPPDVDVVVAGPPCQGFSTAGGYKGEDPRNSLLGRTCEIITKVKPRIAVIENVSALSNARNLGYLTDAIARLTDAGYACESRVLSAELFGVAQNRKRLIIVARSEQRDFSIAGLGSNAPRKTLRDAWNGLTVGVNSHLPELLEPSDRDFKIASRILPGQKLCNVRGGSRSVHTWDIPEVFGMTSWAEREILLRLQRLRRVNRKRDFGDADPLSFAEVQQTFEQNIDKQFQSLLRRGYIRKVDDAYDLTNTFNGKYRRLQLDDFAPTVDTRFGDVRLFLHPFENRGMTVREAARIQGFPDCFAFPPQKAAAFRLIGNAVPPPLGFDIGRFVRDLL